MANEMNEMYYNILDSQFLEALFNSFYEETGLQINFEDLKGSPNKNFFSDKKFKSNPFCAKILSLSSQNMYCKTEAAEMARKAVLLNGRKPLVYTCHSGLVDVVTPVFVKNIHIANLVTGQFRVSEHIEDNFNKKLKLFSKEEGEKISKLYFSTKVFSKEEISKVTNFLSFMSSYISGYGEKFLYDKQTSGGDTENIVRSVRAYINSNYRRPDLSLLQIAKAVGVSPSYISDLYRRKAEQTLTAYIIYTRINFAKYLLGNTAKSIKSICFSCGFTTLQHFYRVFKKYEGLTPSEFRKASKKVAI